MTANRYGLRRTIPEDVKRKVRQRCQFGCIICGNAIVQYEHFDPEFKDAKEHKPEGITLLCGSHHDEKTRGFLSNDEVKKFNASPYCVREGNAFGRMNRAGAMPRVLLGDSVFELCKTFVQFGRERVLWLRKARDVGEGFLLNARFRDSHGKIIFEIIDNEWRIGYGQWDIVTTGNAIIIRSRPNKILLLVRVLPPSDLKIERMEIWHRGRHLKVIKNGSIVIDGRAKFSRVHFRNIHIAIHVGNDGGIGLGVNNSAAEIMYSRLFATTAMTPIFSRHNAWKPGAGNGNRTRN